MSVPSQDGRPAKRPRSETLPHSLAYWESDAFPVDLVVRLLERRQGVGGAPSTPLRNREFSLTSLQGGWVRRWESVTSASDLRALLGPKHKAAKYDIGAAYSTPQRPVRDRFKALADEAGKIELESSNLFHLPEDQREVQERRLEALRRSKDDAVDRLGALKVPVGAELRFEVDMNDEGYWMGVAADDQARLDRYYPVVQTGLTLLRRALASSFGYQNVLTWYTGRRGMALAVLDPGAFALTYDGRLAVASFVSPSSWNGPNRTRDEKAFMQQPHVAEQICTDESFETLIGVADHFFERWCREDPDFFAAALRRLLEPPAKQPPPPKPGQHDKRMMAMRAAQEAVSASRGAKTDWQHAREALRGWGAKAAASALEVVLLRAFWPRLDAPVTRGTEHLIKFVWSPHKSTGRICVPHAASTRLEDFFDPQAAPTARLLAEPDGLDPDETRRREVGERAMQRSVRYVESVAACLEDELARRARSAAECKGKSRAGPSAPEPAVIDLRAPVKSALDAECGSDMTEMLSQEPRACFQTITRLTLQIVGDSLVFRLEERPQTNSARLVRPNGWPPYKENNKPEDVVARCCQSAQSLMEQGEDWCKRYWICSFFKVVFTNEEPAKLNRMLEAVEADASLDRSVEVVRVTQHMASELGSIVRKHVIPLVMQEAEWRPLSKVEALAMQAIALSPDVKLTCLRGAPM